MLDLRHLLAPVVLLFCGAGFAHPGAHEVIASLSAQIAQAPDNLRLYHQRGVAWSEAGEQARARADFSKVAELAGTDAVAHEFGLSYYRGGELELARQWFDRAIAYRPQASSYEYRARVNRDLGAPEAALADYRQAFALRDRPAPGDYIAAADTLLALSGASKKEALALLDQGMGRLDSPSALQRRAIALELERGNHRGALARMHRLGADLRYSTLWQLEMAELELRAGLRADATATLAGARERVARQRQTPARQALEARIEALQAELGGD